MILTSQGHAHRPSKRHPETNPPKPRRSIAGRRPRKLRAHFWRTARGKRTILKAPAKSKKRTPIHFFREHCWPHEMGRSWCMDLGPLK